MAVVGVVMLVDCVRLLNNYCLKADTEMIKLQRISESGENFVNSVNKLTKS